MASMKDLYISGAFADRAFRDAMKRDQELLMRQMMGSWAATTPATPPAPEPVPGKTLLVVGDYMVKHDGKSFHLCRGTTKALTWFTCPDRGMIAAAIRWDRAQQPNVNAKDDFGYLLGVRFFAMTDDFHLKSPHQKTVWESNVLTASEWSEEDVVRGKGGIHAAWPTKSGRVTPRIDFEAKETSLIAKVRGLGRFVKGDAGWRAEKVIIDTVYLPSSLLGRWRTVKRLEKLYPEIIFEEETWTLERSSRLAR